MPTPKHAHRRIVTRRLRHGDIPALLALEHRQWTAEQAATAEDFRRRIDTHPRLCNGAFDAASGELLASLFCKPTTEEEWLQPADWKTSSDLGPRPAPRGRAALFGISLTSVEPRAALQLIAFQFLVALRNGWRHAYLGSPMPGLARHLARHPGACVEAYARARRAGLPADPQLRYYHGRGFSELVAVRPDYFPHAGSHDYGAILRARVPLAWMRPLLALLPTGALRSLAALAPRFAIPADESPS